MKRYDILVDGTVLHEALAESDAKVAVIDAQLSYSHTMMDGFLVVSVENSGSIVSFEVRSSMGFVLSTISMVEV